MMKLSKEQKKIIYIFSVVGVFFFLFWLFVYIPQNSQLKGIKYKLGLAEAEIEEINRISYGKPLPEAVRDLNLRLQKAALKVPVRDEEVVKELSEAARKLKIVLKNISLSNSFSLASKVPGYKIEELPISIKLNCEYREIGQYLNDLRDNFPVLIKIKSLLIQGGGEGQNNLDVDLQISAFLSEG